MLHSIWTSVVVVGCAMSLGAVVGYPQHRFAMPAHFSFRTVHMPASIPQHSPPSRLTLSSPEPLPTPVARQTHVPVMVPVPQNFVGDSVVVTSEDLSNMGLNGALVPKEEAEVAPTMLEAAPEPVVDIEIAHEPPMQEEVIPEVASAAGPLSLADDSFVLTASGQPQPETVAVSDATDPMDNVAQTVEVALEPEIVVDPEVAVEAEVQEPAVVVMEPEAVPVEQPEPAPAVATVIEQEIIPEPVMEVVRATPIAQQVSASPFDTDTFHAYNQFLNTWLQLASVNLNRPDLLRLVNNFQAQPQVEPIRPAPVVAEPQQPLQQNPAVVFEAVDNTPIVETPVEPMIPEIASETPVEITTEALLPFENEPTTTEDLSAVTQAAANIAPEPIVVEETAPAVVEQVIEPMPQVVNTEPVVDPIQQVISTNSIVETVSPSQNVISSVSPELAGHPFAQAVPRYTSRGRLAGFSYSFSHVPRRGGSFFSHRRV